MGSADPFPGVKRGWGVTLTTQPHLVPKQWVGAMPPLSPSAFVACSVTALALYTLNFAVSSLNNRVHSVSNKSYYIKRYRLPFLHRLWSIPVCMVCGRHWRQLLRWYVSKCTICIFLASSMRVRIPLQITPSQSCYYSVKYSPSGKQKAQLVNKFPGFYRTRRFITVLTRARHRSPQHDRWIQSYFHKIVSILSNLRLRLPNVL
jgi:hypothetical protein